SVSNDGQYLFFWDSAQGRNFVQAVNGGAAVALPGTNDANARSNGLWSEAGPLVAYWGFEGGVSVLSATNAANGQTVTLNSGRSAPIAPVGWRPGTTQLVYRDATNFVRIADMGCLNGGCGSNPLETGVELLPATAGEIIVGRDWVYYRDGEQILAVNLGCAGSGNCAGSVSVLGANAAPQTLLDVGGNTLAYTAYTQDARNPGDREVRAINLGCLPSCQPQPVAVGAVAGLVSSDGGYVTADAGGSGLNTVNLSNGSATNLSGAGANLLKARWS
ncbi:MAG: hypothetical protein H7175_07700, partial [Burkholderiales bacterium]|nr:hypothetical protein [Anaerolineae bacterium]